MKRAPALGEMVTVGQGGITAEALADVSFRPALLSRVDAEETIAEVRPARLLTGLRGDHHGDREALVDALLRVGWLAHICPQVSELGINALVVPPEGEGALALDVRLVTE